MNSRTQIGGVSAERKQTGLIYGLIAGLSFALAVWGLDAISLASANSEFPWLKLLIGLPLCLLVGGLAGWLTARFDNALLGFVIWLLAGFAFDVLASHMPFEGIATYIGLTDSEYLGLGIYPFVESTRVRMTLLLFVVPTLSAIAGAVELFVIESSDRATTQLGRFLALSICIPLMVFAGLAADNLINQPLRTPVLTIHQLVEDQRAANINPVSKDEARKLGLNAIKPLQEIVNRPYKLLPGHYDPESISETRINMNFDGIFGQCFAVNNDPIYCQTSTDYVLKRLACLFSQSEQDCRMQVAPDAGPQFNQVREQLGPNASLSIRSQRGNVTLVDVDNGDGQRYQCRIRISGDQIVESCEPLTAVPEKATTSWPIFLAETQATPTPQPTPVAEATQPPAEVVAMHPDQVEDLYNLPLLPRYTISATIDVDNLTFQGQSHLVYTNTEGVPLEKLYFRLIPNGDRSYGNGSLNVSQARLDGQIVTTQSSLEDTVLEIPLAEPLQNGGSMEVEFDFSGKVPEDFGGSNTPSGYGIYNYSDGVLAMANWYPILAVYDEDGWNLDLPSDLGDSVYSDMAYYTVDLTTPGDQVVAASGVATENLNLGQTAHWRFISGPMRDFFLIMSPDFQSSSKTIDRTRVNSYYLPKHTSAGKQALNVAARSLEVYNENFGRYPYKELDIVDAPMRGAAGVEFPGIVLVSSELYDEPDNPFFTVATSHEVAHQWWYNVVGNDVFEDPWLDEALSTFSSGLYFQEEIGQAAYQANVQNWQERYNLVKEANLDDQVTRSLAHFESLPDPRVYGGIVYRKGALFYDALRKEIGDEAFFKALQDYYQLKKYRIARPDDLLNAFEAAAGRQLDELYQQWLYSP